MRILGIDYSLRRSAEGSLLDWRGQHDPDAQEIVIADGLSLQMEERTVLHEIMHAIDDGLGLGLTEEQIHGLASGLHTTLIDAGVEVRPLLREIAPS